MYTPKLMFLIFNLTVVVTGILLLTRGVNDPTPPKLKALERTTDLVYFTKIWTYGGAALILIALLGFWSVDAEKRLALILYKSLLYLAVCAQVTLVCYFALNSNHIGEVVQNKLAEWVEGYDWQNEQTAFIDNVQTFFKCCEFRNSDKIAPSCCPITNNYLNQACDLKDAHTKSCSKTATTYFQKRMRMNLSLLFRAIGPQIAAIIFAEMVAAKILLLQNLMRGKLS